MGFGQITANLIIYNDYLFWANIQKEKNWPFHLNIANSVVGRINLYEFEYVGQSWSNIKGHPWVSKSLGKTRDKVEVHLPAEQ